MSSMRSNIQPNEILKEAWKELPPKAWKAQVFWLLPIVQLNVGLDKPRKESQQDQTSVQMHEMRQIFQRFEKFVQTPNDSCEKSLKVSIKFVQPE